MSEHGRKLDADKPPMDLLDPLMLREVARVLKFGAEKYERHNWRAGIRYSRLLAAAMRHISDFNEGEDDDPESELPHIAHAVCCLMFLLWMNKHRTDMDDRWKP